MYFITLYIINLENPSENKGLKVTNAFVHDRLVQCTLTNTVDPDEMQQTAHLIWVGTIFSEKAIFIAETFFYLSLYSDNSPRNLTYRGSRRAILGPYKLQHWYFDG